MVNCEPYDISRDSWLEPLADPEFHAAVADSELYKFGAIKNFAN